jgi:N-hydroxyarylamine O-acetyltransferase
MPGPPPQPRLPERLVLVSAMDLDAYFARIGFNGARAPTLETLRQIHLAHAQAISFENLNPLLGWPVALDLPSLEEKLVRAGRGGYCFEQNALLATALSKVGFEVTGLAARVLWSAPEDAMTPRTHMLLKVMVAGEPFIADVGFGGQTLTGPIRLTEDVEQSTPHEPFRLVRAEPVEGAPRPFGADLKLQSIVAGVWKTLYRFDLQPQSPTDYELANYYVSTHPTSHFRAGLRAARPAPGRRYALINNQLTVHHLNGPSERQVLTSVSEVKDALVTHFGLTLPATPALDATLERVCSSAA